MTVLKSGTGSVNDWILGAEKSVAAARQPLASCVVARMTRHGKAGRRFQNTFKTFDAFGCEPLKHFEHLVMRHTLAVSSEDGESATVFAVIMRTRNDKRTTRVSEVMTLLSRCSLLLACAGTHP